jgi:endonuclease YncB( thermonuclease family)
MTPTARSISIFLATALASLAAASADAQQFQARVLSVQSGDSFTASVYGRPWRMRLADVVATDAKTGRSALASVIGGRTVDVNVQGTDSDGRMIARVSASGTDVSAAMLGRGAVKSGSPAVAQPNFASEKVAATARAAPAKSTVAVATPARTSGSGNIREEEVRDFLKGVPEMAAVRAAGLR